MKFSGGYSFNNFEGVAKPALHEYPIPETVFVPLKNSPFSIYEPVIKKGDLILAGEQILRGKEDPNLAMVSPVNGTIKTISEAGITIEPDGSVSFKAVEGHPRAPWHMDRESVFGIFCSTGCALLLNRYFSSLTDLDSVKYIVINAVHNSPLNQSWTPGISGDSSVLSDGLKTLRTLFPNTETVIAINRKNKTYFEVPEIKENAKIKIMSDRYPQEHPELLSRDTFNKRLTSPEGDSDDSILIIQFEQVIQIAEVMTRGRPFIDLILLIAGPGVSHPGWYRIRIGTTFENIRRNLIKAEEHGPWRIIRGNPLEGIAVNDLTLSVLPTDGEISVIREHAVRELFRFVMPGFTFDSYSKTTVGKFISILPKHLDSGVHGGVRPCVQCNYCDEVCPVGIYPHLIWKYVQAEDVEESFRLKSYDCIGCKLCDYVCPSKIDISATVEWAKNDFRIMRKIDEISD